MGTESIDKAYATQIANIEKSTGKKLKEWITIINKSGFAKHGELVSFLKEKHGFTHGNANTIVHFARQSHAGAAENDTDWIAEQYKGKENLKPWYDKIMGEINKFGKDAINSFAEGDEQRMMLLGLKRFTKVDAFNGKDAKRRIAARLINENKYPL